MTAMRSKHPDQIVDAEDMLEIVAEEAAVDGMDQTLAAAAEVEK